MTKGKNIVLIALVGAICSASGVWLGKWRADRYHSELFTLNECLLLEHQVKVLALLYDNNSTKAAEELERRLNIEILTLGAQNPDHPRSLGENELTALRLAARHRDKHPFTAGNPSSNKLVKIVLQNVN